MLRLLLATALTGPSLTAIGACDSLWVEGLCMEDEVFIQYRAGGAGCRAQQEGDPDCAEGEIPREQRPSRELDCIPNDISREPPYGE